MPTDKVQAGATFKYHDTEFSGPVELINKAIYLVFAGFALWLWITALDSGRAYFEKKGYTKITQSIFFLKLLGFALFVAFIIYCFFTGRI